MIPLIFKRLFPFLKGTHQEARVQTHKPTCSEQHNIHVPEGGNGVCHGQADTDSVPDPCVERSSAMKFNNRWRSLGDTELWERTRHGGPPRATPLRGGGDWAHPDGRKADWGFSGGEGRGRLTTKWVRGLLSGGQNVAELEVMFMQHCDHAECP